MSTATTITVTAAACAFVVSALLLAGTALGGHRGERAYRQFSLMLLFNAVGACCEGAATLLIGTPGPAVAFWFRLADFFSYACGSLVGIAFALYLREYLAAKGRVARAPFVLMVACNAANVVLVAAGELGHWLSRLDAHNQYHSQGMVWLAQLLPLLFLLAVVAVTCRYIRALRPREWVPLLLYAAIPMLCYGVEYAFNTTPVLWVSYFGSTVALLLLYINLQAEVKRRLDKKDAELAESRIAIMLSQIQPHFLYNALTTIGVLCGTAPHKAKAAVADFAHYLRGNLDALTTRGLVPFEDELDHVEAYLALERLRFGGKLRVRYQIEAGGFLLPPLTVQPIVENAVQHGVLEKDGGGTVRIGAVAAGATVRITVEDDGVGFDPAAPPAGGAHVGIENVRGRLATLCKGGLELQSAPGGGTRATITLPYLAQKEEQP